VRRRLLLLQREGRRSGRDLSSGALKLYVDGNLSSTMTVSGLTSGVGLME
jgi:hypothetical protein